MGAESLSLTAWAQGGQRKRGCDAGQGYAQGAPPGTPSLHQAKHQAEARQSKPPLPRLHAPNPAQRQRTQYEQVQHLLQAQHAQAQATLQQQQAQQVQQLVQQQQSQQQQAHVRELRAQERQQMAPSSEGPSSNEGLEIDDMLDVLDSFWSDSGDVKSDSGDVK